MNILRSKILFFSFAALLMLSLMILPAIASEPIAKVSQFKGDVIILSGEAFIKVTKVGQPVKEGDRIQTEDGEAEITFNDGAVLKIRPYANIMIQEGEEKSGALFFEKRGLVRRITCFVGTLRFNSGPSKKENYLQTPTAVCGLRGSVMEFGFDNVMAYISEIEGSAIAKGEIQKVVEEFFKNLQANAQNNAQLNSVYNKFAEAYKLHEEQEGTKEAQAALLEAIQLSIETLLQNDNLSDEAWRILQEELQRVIEDLKNLGVDVTTTVTITTTTTTETFPATTTTEKSPLY